MKMIIRKNDSSMSLLLFVYNLYDSHTSKTSMKLSHLLDIIQRFGKSETAIRMSLSRAVKAGLLEKQKEQGEVYYSLTMEGKEAIRLWNEGVSQFWKRYQLRHKDWEGKWYILHSDWREVAKETKTVVLDRLQQLGFISLRSSLWITPYHQREEIKSLIKEFGLHQELIEFYGEMETGNEMCQFLEEEFQLQPLKEGYRDFVQRFKPRLLEMKKGQPEWLPDGGHVLPVLHELGWSFFKVASEDAVLPKALYPIWEEDEAARLMREFRELLIPHIHRYFDTLTKEKDDK